MRFRHLDYPRGTPVEELGPAAIEALLERGDLGDWRPLAAAIRADPNGPLAERVLRLCEIRPMYGTSTLWRAWIERLRQGPDRAAARSPAELRRRRGLTQQEVGRRMGISQSDVSKLERRPDLRLSTLRGFVEATGGQLVLGVRYPDERDEIRLELSLPAARDR